jgi:hypothetical protein
VPPGDGYVEREVVRHDTLSGDAVVERRLVTAAATERRVVTSRRVDPAAILAVIGGIALGVVGAAAMTRAGLSSPLDEPVVQVAGADHTAILGMIELGAGLLLLWAGLGRDRGPSCSSPSCSAVLRCSLRSTIRRRERPSDRADVGHRARRRLHRPGSSGGADAVAID